MYTAGNAHLLWSGHFPIQKVLSTEQQTDKYAATMETAAATKEDALFSNVSATSTAKPAGFSNDNNNQRASKLNGAVGTAGNKRVGPSIVLKVMTGDTISISTWSWYSGAVQPPATGVADIATELLPLLTAGVSGAGGSKGGAIPTTYSDPLLSGDLRKFLDSNRVYSGTRPKAFLNWMVVDEEFAGVKSTNYMSAVQIPLCNAGDTLKQVVGLNQMVIRRNGWIYIYLSNESNQDVFFDNLVVNLTHGPLVEQKDYYAFGLEIPGLCTKAIKQNYIDNRYKYNGKELQNKEFSDGTGLEEYDYGARMYDPQIGRWVKIDNKAELYKNISPYTYAGNQPTNAVDPDGNLIIFINGQNLSGGGTSAYWKSANGQNFDVAVQKHFNDVAPSRYYDGSSGGWGNTLQNSYNPLSSIFTDDNRIAQDRQDAGYSQGMNDARSILISLHRTGGVIDESLKIVTHSMGGAYAKGFVKAIVEYAKAHPEISNGLKISEFDFDPFQAGSLEVEPKVHTEQYTHNGKKHIPWWKFWDTDKIADEKQRGLESNNPNGDNNS